jgi:hypothetical protein
MRSVPTCYEQYKSIVYLAERQLPASKDVNTEAEEATALEAVIGQRLVKAQQNGKI